MRISISADLTYRKGTKVRSRWFRPGHRDPGLVGQELLVELTEAVDKVLVKNGYQPNRLQKDGHNRYMASDTFGVTVTYE